MADVFVLDSYYEGWSIAATEALYEGLPIIHSMCGSALELTNGGRYGYVIPNPAGELEKISNSSMAQIIERGEYINTKELVNVLQNMIKNNLYWEKKRTAIAQECQIKFSIQGMLQKYLEIIIK